MLHAGEQAEHLVGLRQDTRLAARAVPVGTERVDKPVGEVDHALVARHEGAAATLALNHFGDVRDGRCTGGGNLHGCRFGCVASGFVPDSIPILGKSEIIGINPEVASLAPAHSREALPSFNKLEIERNR